MKLFACCLTIVTAAVAPANASPKCDLSTDAGVDAAYKAATGREMSTYGGRCARRSTTFPAMYVIGAFAADLGCQWEGAFHNCTWNDDKAAATEMAAAGWAKADAKKRGELAVAWLREIDQISLEDEKTSIVDGKLVVEFWKTNSSGMTQAPPKRTHYKTTFEADGTHGRLTRF